jgi:two-component system, LytTR family, response regulator LytT
MDLVIVEDEQLSAERLKHLVLKIDSSINVKEILPSVELAQEWFRDNSPPDVLLLDIQLSDGTAFDFLKSITTFPSIIFTTAYDEYALKAFKYNSIEYLLKPIEEEQLAKALQKFKALNRMPSESNTIIEKIESVQKSITGNYKRRFLIKIGEQFLNVDVNQISYLFYENGACFLTTKAGKKMPIDYSLDQLEEILNPMEFFRINRQYLIRSEAIEEIHTYLNSRLLLKLKPDSVAEIIVSRDRVNNFKRWMDC